MPNESNVGHLCIATGRSMCRLSFSRASEVLWSFRTRPVSEVTLRGRHAEIPQERTRLEELAASHGDEVFTKWWHYFEVYDEVLGDIAAKSCSGQLERPLRVLEIGVWKGGSLQLWRKYFG